MRIRDTLLECIQSRDNYCSSNVPGIVLEDISNTRTRKQNEQPHAAIRPRVIRFEGCCYERVLTDFVFSLLPRARTNHLYHLFTCGAKQVTADQLAADEQQAIVEKDVSEANKVAANVQVIKDDCKKVRTHMPTTHALVRVWGCVQPPDPRARSSTYMSPQNKSILGKSKWLDQMSYPVA